MEQLDRTEHAHGLGLRAQILLALGAAFLLSFTALGVIVVQVAHKAQDVERSRRNLASAEVLAVSLQAIRDGSSPQQTLERMVGRADIVGVSLGHPQAASVSSAGDTEGRPLVRTQLGDGSELSLWSAPVEAESRSPLGRLLRLYLLLTGALILLTAYVALTRLIVRPVENLTQASERLATGTLATAVPVGGAAEIARLAISFNRMARDLRVDRASLETRVEELLRATRELRKTQDQLIRSEKLASVGRLSAGIAHEIGNPLAAILGFVELLQSGGLPEADEREFLRRVKHEVERIHRIIRELLDYSRADAQPPSADEEADLTRVVEEAVKLVAPQKDLRGINIERRFAEDLPRVRGSESELIQLVLNLLLNAADAVSGDGSILIEVADEAPSELLLAVSDSGPGIADDVRDKLFEPFVTTKPPGKGTGLGLAVSQAIVLRLGGSIRAENQPPRGARFEVRVPKTSNTH
jgi:two-component system NtrC family sensor kinase